MRDRALVLFSGGQDSTTCLAWALVNFHRVETVGFRYGQRHAVEIDCRPKILAELHARFPAWGKKLGEDHVLDLDVIRSLGATAMTHDVAIRMTESGLPNTFVPGRNLLFFTAAAALAYRKGVRVLVGGMCETDFSGYPDCRDDTWKALQGALGPGMGRVQVLRHGFRRRGRYLRRKVRDGGGACRGDRAAVARKGERAQVRRPDRRRAGAPGRQALHRRAARAGLPRCDRDERHA